MDLPEGGRRAREAYAKILPGRPMNQLFTPPPRSADAACSAASIAPFASFFAAAAAGFPRSPPAEASMQPLSPGRHEVALGTFAKTVARPEPAPAPAPAPDGLPSPRGATGRAASGCATAGGRTVSGRARVATNARCADRSIVGIARSGRATRSMLAFPSGVETTRSGREKAVFPATCAEAVGAMVAINVAPRTSENPRRTCEDAMETPLERGRIVRVRCATTITLLHISGQRHERGNSPTKPQKSADPLVEGSALASRS